MSRRHVPAAETDHRDPRRHDSPASVVGSRLVMVDLDTRLLRAFVAVAEELSFTRAAQRLFLAQQALSSQVQQLETRLGVKLFERTTRKVELTEAGERLLPHARAALEALATATKELDALKRAERTTLRVGLSGTAMVALVGETIR